MQPRAMDPMPPRNSSPDSSRTAGFSGGGVDEGGSASAEGDGTSLPLFGVRSGGGVVSFSTTGRKPTVGVGSGVCSGVGSGVGMSVGAGVIVGAAVRLALACASGAGVDVAVADGVGSGVGTPVGEDSGADRGVGMVREIGVGEGVSGVGGIEGVVEAGIPVGAVTAVGLEEGFSSAVG